MTGIASDSWRCCKGRPQVLRRKLCPGMKKVWRERTSHASIKPSLTWTHANEFSARSSTSSQTVFRETSGPRRRLMTNSAGG